MVLLSIIITIIVSVIALTTIIVVVVSNKKSTSVTLKPTSLPTLPPILTLTGNLQFDFNSVSSMCFDYINGNLWVSNSSSITIFNTLNPYNTSTILTSNIYGFNDIRGMASDNTSMWVTNYLSNSIHKINLKNFSLYTVLQGSPYNFQAPNKITNDGKNMWIITSLGSSGNGSIVVVNIADNSQVTNINNSSCAFSAPYWLTFDGSRMWVVNWQDNSLCVIDSTTFVCQNVGNPQVLVNCRTSLYDGTTVWVAPYNSVVGYLPGNIGTNPYAIPDTFLNNPNFQITNPISMAFDGSNLWITNGSIVSVIQTKNVSNFTTFNSLQYGLSNISLLYYDGTRMWLSDYNSNMIVGIFPYVVNI